MWCLQGNCSPPSLSLLALQTSSTPLPRQCLVIGRDAAAADATSPMAAGDAVTPRDAPPLLQISTQGRTCTVPGQGLWISRIQLHAASTALSAEVDGDTLWVSETGLFSRSARGSVLRVRGHEGHPLETNRLLLQRVLPAASLAQHICDEQRRTSHPRVAASPGVHRVQTARCAASERSRRA